MMVSQRSIARVTGTSPSTVSRVLGRDPTARISRATRERILRAAAELGYDSSRVRRWYKRSSKRLPVSSPCRVQVIRRSGELYDEGQARVVNVSSTGALLTDLDLPKESLPTTPFVVRLKFLDQEVIGTHVDCEVVRLAGVARVELGIRFTSPVELKGA